MSTMDLSETQFDYKIPETMSNYLTTTMAHRTRDDQTRLPKHGKHGSSYEVPVPSPIPEITNSSHLHAKPHLLKLHQQPNCNLLHMWPPSQAHQIELNANGHQFTAPHPDNTGLRATVKLCRLGSWMEEVLHRQGHAKKASTNAATATAM